MAAPVSAPPSPVTCSSHIWHRTTRRRVSQPLDRVPAAAALPVARDPRGPHHRRHPLRAGRPRDAAQGTVRGGVGGGGRWDQASRSFGIVSARIRFNAGCYPEHCWFVRHFLASSQLLTPCFWYMWGGGWEGAGRGWNLRQGEIRGYRRWFLCRGVGLVTPSKLASDHLSLRIPLHMKSLDTSNSHQHLDSNSCHAPFRNVILVS